MNSETSTLPSEQQDLHDALVFLKGIIVSYSVAKGMKYDSKHAPTPLFEEGMTLGADIADRWNGKEIITALHVLYNRLRHNRPHTGSVETDEKALSEVPSWPAKVIREHFDIEINTSNPKVAFAAVTGEKMEVVA